MTLQLHLTVCDGFGKANECVIEGLEGSISIAHLAHERGYACWLWDRAADTLVACSTAGCFACSHEPVCGDSLDVNEEGVSAAFFSDLLNPVAAER